MMTLSVDPAPIEAERFDAMRHAMVASQLRTNAVNAVRVVEAMARVPREAYLPDVHRAIAYRDTLLPLGDGRRQNSPLATGRLLTEAQLAPTDHVMLIGAAGGSTAAGRRGARRAGGQRGRARGGRGARGAGVRDARGDAQRHCRQGTFGPGLVRRRAL